VLRSVPDLGATSPRRDPQPRAYFLSTRARSMGKGDCEFSLRNQRPRTAGGGPSLSLKLLTTP